MERLIIEARRLEYHAHINAYTDDKRSNQVF